MDNAATDEPQDGQPLGLGLSELLGPLAACKTARDSWSCKNMRPVDGDTSMTHEHYACNVCGRRMALDYDEMR